MDLLATPRPTQAARRAMTATSILDVGSWIGLFAGIIFWGNFFLLMLAPTTVLEVALALGLAIGYSVVLPMLLSTLVPSTPAGMLLQQTKWRTFGFAATVGITGFLGYHALMILWAWWASRPTVEQTGQALPLAIGSLIIFVFVPALSWVQAAPDRWVAEVQAAMAVRRLKMAHEANIMAAKTQYIRALSLLRRGVANLTAAEQQEVAGTLIAFQRAENEAIGAIVDTLEVMTGVSTGVDLIDDEQLADAYAGITQKLGKLIAAPREADYVELSPAAARTPPVTPYRSGVEPWDGAELPPAQQDAETVDRDRDRDRAPAVRHGPPRTTDASTAVDVESLEAAVAARPELPGAWSRADLERVMSIQKTKANDLIRVWRQAGLIYDITRPAHHYAWTGPEVMTAVLNAAREEAAR